MKSAVLNFKGNYRFALALAVIAALLTAAGTLVLPAGSLDPTFGKNGVTITDVGGDSDTGNAVGLQSDGKIVIAGSAVQHNPYHRTQLLLRYNSNGAPDASFGTNGRITTEAGNFVGFLPAIQPDGKLLMAGQLGAGFAVARYNSGGSLDTSFGTSGIASHPVSGEVYDGCTDMAVQPNGGILLAGNEEIGNYIFLVLQRFKSDGTPDADFNLKVSDILWRAFPTNRYSLGEGVVIQGDGKIILSASMTDNDDDAIGLRIILVRLNTDGSLDSTFGLGGTVKTAVANFENATGALALQPDGKIIVAGTSFPIRGSDQITNDVGVARFNADGSPDTTFGGSGVVSSDFGNDEYGKDAVPQPDGKVVVVGTSNGLTGFMLLRYNADGSLDTSFGENGKVVSGFGGSAQSANGVVRQPDGKILVVGSTDGNGALARYYGAAKNASLVTVNLRSQATNDGWLLESTETSNLGGTLDKLATTFNVGDNAKDRQYRGLISFNTSPIPDTAVIAAAQLNIKRQGLVGTNPYTTHGPLLLDMRSGAFSNNVTLQLTDFSAPATPGAIQEQLSALPLINWYGCTLSAGNLPFINRLGITQFRLQFSKDDNDDMSADYLKFFSGNSDLANQPQLIITYYVP